LADSDALINIIPGATHIDVLSHYQHTGWQFRWNRILAKTHFEGCGECTAYVPHKILSYLLGGGLKNELSWLLEPTDDGTSVTMIVAFDVPIPLKNRHTQGEIRAEYETEAVQILTSLAARLVQPKTTVESPLDD
jgi:hypothetical protein